MSYESQATTSAIFLDVGRVEYPFSANGDAVTLDVYQTFAVRPESYTPATLNDAYSSSANLTSHPTGSIYCVGDTPPSPIDGGLVTFTRRWSKIPATRYDYETYVATFPGVLYQRNPFQKSVTSQIEFNYYMVGSGLTYATAADIPVVSPTSFRYSGDALDRDADDMFLTTTTTPSQSTWETAVSTAAFSYVVEPSTLTRYAGNIWLRTTRRVRPL